MNPILLDTHAAVWAADGLLKGEAAALVEAAAERDELLLSPITAWEIGLLVRKKRLSVTSTIEDYIRALFGQPGVVLAALTPLVAVAATVLPGSPLTDPADRLLVATAAAYGARFVTRDREIRAYAKSTGHIRCIAC
ncbi:MAG: type II toxin-antitoxin system VapC family toxin [Candidatus Eremiobacteraeota bacterium]|nr:type II toxin-antitoxin system VapC family toxin [Candidatus Eremiobacteraeota bacterium]MBV8499438.1 type II toxin-antitoxin system VapC family toxin [Candidatus Eremiobacteraeota bacterium]